MVAINTYLKIINSKLHSFSVFNEVNILRFTTGIPDIIILLNMDHNYCGHALIKNYYIKIIVHVLRDICNGRILLGNILKFVFKLFVFKSCHFQ